MGNYGTQMYGSSLPAIHGGATLTDLLYFGSTVTTTGDFVDHQQTLGVFPQNVNFTTPEPATMCLLVAGSIMGIMRRRKIAR